MFFKIFFFSSILSTLFFISCSTTQLPPHEQTSVSRDFFGIVHAGNPGTDEEYRLLNEMGAVWLLQTFYWSAIEREQGNFNFTWYDNFVNTAKLNNKKVIAVLAYDVEWFKKKGENHRYVSNKNISHFLNYVESTVNHFTGRVDAWQIWNEPNWIFWNGSDNEFFELSKRAAKKIREIDPDAYIIGGGFLRSPANFIKNFHKSGAAEHLDALSFHPYGINPANAMQVYDQFLKIIKEINFTGDIWITEIGYPTGGWYPIKVSLENFPSYVIKSIAGAAARGSKTLLWYHLFDHHLNGKAPDNFNSEMFFGLIYRDYSRKNGSYAYELCARYLPGARYMPNLPLKSNVPNNIVSFCFMQGAAEKNTLILWNDMIGKQQIRVTLSVPITLHDISTGKSAELTDGSTLDITASPVFITWEGDTLPQIFGGKR